MQYQEIGMRCLAMLAMHLGACGPNGADTDPANDTDAGTAGPSFDCVYPDLVGDWTAELHEPASGGMPETDWEATMSLRGQANKGDVLGGIHWYTDDRAAPDDECDTEMVCLDTNQNDWIVIQERPIGDCASPGYWFFQLADADTITAEWGFTEFGERPLGGTFRRAL
ncbi:MAG: hypothetical protein ACI9MC_001432 [Kiritimatiellia bacterium]|jgi:hypothetical protein